MTDIHIVKITEKLEREIYVKADSKAEAEEIAEELCNRGTVNLTEDDFASRECVETGLSIGVLQKGEGYYTKDYFCKKT